MKPSLSAEKPVASRQARRAVGKGEMIFCQMPLHRHLTGPDADPVAQTVMVNLPGP